MRVLHIVPGLDEVGNGISVAAWLIASAQGARVVDAKCVSRALLEEADEVWVHSMWTLPVIRACRLALKAGRPLVRMLHACVDPLRLRYHGWRKWLVGPVERRLLRRADRLVATCEAEKGWIESYLGKRCPPIEVVDIKRFFNLDALDSVNPVNPAKKGLNILYLGRRHPLKGVKFLEAAVSQIEKKTAPQRLCARIISNAYGDELERVWNWCDVLVLPTLSENFGLVVAEALERGKRVITTDGAQAWECECNVESDKCETGDAGAIWQGHGGRLVYLKGYRDGSDEKRVELLRSAIERFCG